MSREITYGEAKQLIKEADVLLFKSGPFPSAGWWITKYTGGRHSHVGLAHIMDGEVYCVEQREFLGGRMVTLRSQVEQNPHRIEVYRASPVIYEPYFEDGEIVWKSREFSNDVAKNVVDFALQITGQPYGWKNIWTIFKSYAPGFRLVYNKPNGDTDIPKEYVCSTVVTAAYRKYYADPCPNLSDIKTKPSDLAQSHLFHYLFTISDLG